MKLYRGTYYGVFAGANGLYVAALRSDGSHYQPSHNGLRDLDIDSANRQARAEDDAEKQERQRMAAQPAKKVQ